MRRGDIWTGAEATDYGRKPRPLMIIQSDVFDGLQSVVAVPFTSAARDAPLLRIRVDPTPANGLSQTSWLMVDKITTYRQSRLRDRLGRLEAEHLSELELALLVLLGIADRTEQVS